jgi:peptide/nickel transport system ATP-binding protein
MPKIEAMAQAKELFDPVGLALRAIDRYPHEFSCGQHQRIGLSRALALLDDLRTKLGLSTVFITHDLRVAAQVCDVEAVIKAGELVECGPNGRLFGEPNHPYTQAILASLPGRVTALLCWRLLARQSTAR